MKIKIKVAQAGRWPSMTNYAPDCPVSKGIAEMTRNKKYVPSSMLYILREAGVEIEYTGKKDAALDAMGCEYKGAKKQATVKKHTKEELREGVVCNSVEELWDIRQQARRKQN